MASKQCVAQQCPSTASLAVRINAVSWLLFDGGGIAREIWRFNIVELCEARSFPSIVVSRRCTMGSHCVFHNVDNRCTMET
jgi:hypothetical protein